MGYWKAMGLFFLMYSIVEAIRGLLDLRNDKGKFDGVKLGIYITGFFIGGLWVFLLFIFFIGG